MVIIKLITRGGKKMAKLSEVVNQLNEENKITEAQIEQEKLDAIKHKMGSLISKVCEWSGQDILDVVQIALEDSNYHTENKSITKLREQLKLQTEMEYCKNI
jgi:hypothetical protein